MNGDSLGICLPFKAPISWEHFLLLYEALPATAGDYLSSPGLNEEEEEEEEEEATERRQRLGMRCSRRSQIHPVGLN